MRILWRSARISLGLVGAMWLVHLLGAFPFVDTTVFGIYPRVLEALPGVLLSPLIHGGFSHLISNSLPVFLLGTGLLYYYRNEAPRAVAWIWLGGGLAVWLLARPSFHIGASGLVYGAAAFIFLSGLLRREPPAIALSLIVIFLYGGLIWGVLPIQPGVSWEAHLFGAMAGITAALQNRRRGLKQRASDWEQRYAAGYNEDGEFTYEDDDYQDDPERGIYR